MLLYYYYVHIEDPKDFATLHLKFCNSLELKGRILVAEEGINGTVSGTIAQTDAYMEAMKADPLFSGIVFKIDGYDGHTFKKMHCRSRPELVNLSLEDDVNPHEITGNYLSPKEFHEALLDDDTVVLDARNDYEYDLGHFRGAIRPDIETFRELPNWVRKNKDIVDGKRILTYCTGGIRCEKFSGWLKREGFEDVHQLDGGIVSYGKDEDVKGALWDGKCYVFDERLSVPINHTEHVIIGRDHFDNTPCERYVNCANPVCNEQIIASEENEHKYMRGCTHACRVSPRNMYVKEHQLTRIEIEERLALLNETFDKQLNI